ncbi:hypothetical protein ACIGO8_28005 [Streptomyces sp. NPDC053493]|uniref:hypothetical protein n=1 Tax=Streptomyces sp. NPDC053493 TaxID=3365705 RepID=UPI0037D6687E
MHGTRTTVTLLAGVAMAALAGCVAVEAPPAAPAPVTSGPAAGPAGQDVAPQIVEGPAREALEAAMPGPATPEPRSSVARHETARSGPVRPHRTEKPRPSSVPKKQQQQRRRPAVPPGVPEMPRTRAEVCALGQSYGGWSPDSPQARLCRSGYGPPAYGR